MRKRSFILLLMKSKFCLNQLHSKSENLFIFQEPSGRKNVIFTFNDNIHLSSFASFPKPVVLMGFV